jgi:hypothetical protein
MNVGLDEHKKPMNEYDFSYSVCDGMAFPAGPCLAEAQPGPRRVVQALVSSRRARTERTGHGSAFSYAMVFIS